MIKKLLTTKEAALHLNVSISMLAKDRMNKGDIPYTRVGKRMIRYSEEDLNAYIKNKKSKKP